MSQNFLHQDVPILRELEFFWEMEFRSVVSGEQDSNIRRLGSVKEHINRVIHKTAQATSPTLSETTFKRAIRSFIQEWRPTNLSTDESVSRMLDLIQAYMPQDGELKIIGFMKRWGRFGEAHTVPDGENGLHTKAMTILDQYFFVAPDHWRESGGPFFEYVELLKEDINHPFYCGYATGKLVQLNIIRINDIDPSSLTANAPAYLRGLLSTFLHPVTRSRNENVISQIYNQCLSIGGDLPRRFRDEIIAYGGSFNVDSLSVEIRGESIPLKLSGEMLRKHNIAFWNHDLHFTQITQILSGAATPFMAVKPLSAIYTQCLKLGREIAEKFEYELEKNGAQLAHEDNGPVIIQANTRIPLVLSGEDWNNYIPVRLSRWSGQVSNVDERIRKEAKAASN